MTTTKPPEDLHALYREAADAEPPPLLDRRILDAARAEVQVPRPAKRHLPWLRHWLTATSALAVAVLGVSVAWRVSLEDERAQREVASSLEARRDTAEFVPDRSGSGREKLEGPSIETKAKETVAPMAKTAQSARTGTEMAKSESAPAAASSPAMSLPVMPAPVPAAALVAKKTAQADAAMPEERASTRDMARNALGMVSPPADDAATPEAWVKHIRELRVAGRVAEAERSLARLRERYPNYLVPDDLKSN